MVERQTHPWVVPLGTISKNQNWSNDFSRPFFFNVFSTIDFLFHFYQFCKNSIGIKKMTIATSLYS
jgi:glycopeptide antibiotics resistance protein